MGDRSPTCKCRNGNGLRNCLWKLGGACGGVSVTDGEGSPLLVLVRPQVGIAVLPSDRGRLP